MKRNVTISLDEKTLEAARKYAALHGKSFQELARELIERTVNVRQSDQDWEFFEIADRLKPTLGGWKWDRDELYEKMLAPSKGVLYDDDLKG